MLELVSLIVAILLSPLLRAARNAIDEELLAYMDDFLSA